MSIFFDNCDISINGSGIIADSVSIKLDNSSSPIYTIGRKGSFNQIPNGPIKNSFQISYIPEISNEPSYNVASGLKDLLIPTGFTGVTIVVGGITGYNCYLESYSIQAQSNQLIRSNANYVSFLPVSGLFLNRATGNRYNLSDTMAHGWTTFILNNTGNPVYNFDYSYEAGWQPTYVLGRKDPSQVDLMRGSEKMSFTRDIFQNIIFSGENASGSFLNITPNQYTVQLSKISLCCSGTTTISLNFNVSGAIISSTQVEAKVDDILKSTTTITKYF